MNFWTRLKGQEHLNRLVVYLWTDEQQEFLDRAELLKEAKEKFFNETIKEHLSQEELNNEERYNYLLDKAIIFSRLSNKDRLWILLLTDGDQRDYVYWYLKIRSILNSDEVHYWDSDFNLEKYNLLLEKANSRYDSRSLLKTKFR